MGSATDIISCERWDQGEERERTTGRRRDALAGSSSGTGMIDARARR